MEAEKLNLTYSQLEEIVEKLIETPPKNEESLQENKKYLDLALSDEQKAEAFLISSRKESELIGEFLRMEIELESAPAAEKADLRQSLRCQEEKMIAAARATMLLSLVEDHRIRGNIRFMKNYLTNLEAT